MPSGMRSRIMRAIWVEAIGGVLKEDIRYLQVPAPIECVLAHLRITSDTGRVWGRRFTRRGPKPIVW